MRLILTILLFASTLNAADRACECVEADAATLTARCEDQIWKDSLGKKWDKHIDKPGSQTMQTRLLAFFPSKDAAHITTAVCAFGITGDWCLGILRWARVKADKPGAWEYRWTVQVEDRAVDIRWQEQMIDRARKEAGQEPASNQEG